MGKRSAITAAIGVLHAAALLNAGVTLHVDDDAPPGGDGLTWATAYADLQDALDAANMFHSEVEIRVAEGIYTPDRGIGDREISFDLHVGSVLSAVPLSLALLGGFAGIGAKNPDERDPTRFPTILSGDLAGDDMPGLLNRDENAYHVVTVASAMIAGFTIRGGNANGPRGFDVGGGVRVGFGGARFVNCTVQDNAALFGGGGVYVSRDQVTMSACTIFANTVTSRLGAGGGIGTSSWGWAALWGSDIRQNSAGSGGGIATSAFVSVRQCTVTGNTAYSAGGGIYSSTGRAVIERSVVSDNTAGVWGGGLYLGPTPPYGRTLVVSRSILAGNVAQYAGGAIYAESDPLIRNSLLLFNQAGGVGGAVAAQLTAEPKVQWCTLVGNSAARGGAASADGPLSSVTINACILWENTATVGGSALYADQGALIVQSSDVQDGESGVLLEGDAQVQWDPRNFDADPLFEDPLGPDGQAAAWEDNDYHLSFASPCIDAAPRRLERIYTTDFDELPRNVNGNGDCQADPDLGPFERQETFVAPPAPVLFVRADAPSGGDGLTWASAYVDLQDALRTPGVNEVWVAQGTYRPDFGTRDRDESFEIVCDVAIYGGFAGDETSLDQRDPASNPTILSGDLVGRASRNVVRIDDASVRLDGLVITGGGGGFSSHGAGVRIRNSSVAVGNCRFVGNSAGPRNGGAIWSDSELAVVNSTFVGNTSGDGGAVWSNSDLLITSCTFVGNTAGRGGAIDSSSDLVVTNCTFIGNTAREGGAIFTFGDLDLTQSLLVGNSGSRSTFASTGTIDLRGTLTASLDTFVFNDGKIIEAHGSPATLTNSIVWPMGARPIIDPDVAVSYSRVPPGITGPGVIHDNPMFVLLPRSGADRIWGTADDPPFDLSLQPRSPAIDAADSGAIPPDLFDLDHDGDTSEPTPIDLAGDPRLHDDTGLLDLGVGPVGYLDMGAFEFGGQTCLADLTGDGRVDIVDLFALRLAFFEGDLVGDMNRDRRLDITDFFEFIRAFVRGCP